MQVVSGQAVTWQAGEGVVGRVREVRLSELRPWPENPRGITADRLEELKLAMVADRAMLEARPLAALPDGTVIGGNQRLRAAVELGWVSVPVLTVDLDLQRARQFALRDNQSYGHWQEGALAEMLAELAAGGVDLALTGFSDRDITRILGLQREAVGVDDVPVLSVEAPVSKPGGIYRLGPHRLACGDARDSQLLEQLCGGVRPGLLWTDPPYGVDYAGKTAAELRIANDDGGAAGLLEEALRAAAPLLAEGARFYIASPAGPQGTGFRKALDGVGWRHHQTLAWVKNSFVLGHSDYHYQHEDVLFGYVGGRGRPGRGRHTGSRWNGDNAQSSVLFFDRPARSVEHPTMKPVALIAQMLANSSRRGDPVLDLFAGSGSTLIAAEQLERRCLLPSRLTPGTAT